MKREELVEKREKVVKASKVAMKKRQRREAAEAPQAAMNPCFRILVFRVCVDICPDLAGGGQDTTNS
eukprot:1186966-Prorocentrum_minimum.AAC.2